MPNNSLTTADLYNSFHSFIISFRTVIWTSPIDKQLEYDADIGSFSALLTPLKDAEPQELREFFAAPYNHANVPNLHLFLSTEVGRLFLDNPEFLQYIEKEALNRYCSFTLNGRENEIASPLSKLLQAGAQGFEFLVRHKEIFIPIMDPEVCIRAGKTSSEGHLTLFSDTRFLFHLANSPYADILNGKSIVDILKEYDLPESNVDKDKPQILTTKILRYKNLLDDLDLFRIAVAKIKKEYTDEIQQAEVNNDHNKKLELLQRKIAVVESEKKIYGWSAYLNLHQHLRLRNYPLDEVFKQFFGTEQGSVRSILLNLANILGQYFFEFFKEYRFYLNQKNMNHYFVLKDDEVISIVSPFSSFLDLGVEGVQFLERTYLLEQMHPSILTIPGIYTSNGVKVIDNVDNYLRLLIASGAGLEWLRKHSDVISLSEACLKEMVPELLKKGGIFKKDMIEVVNRGKTFQLSVKALQGNKNAIKDFKDLVDKYNRQENLPRKNKIKFDGTLISGSDVDLIIFMALNAEKMDIIFKNVVLESLSDVVQNPGRKGRVQATNNEGPEHSKKKDGAKAKKGGRSGNQNSNKQNNKNTAAKKQSSGKEQTVAELQIQANTSQESTSKSKKRSKNRRKKKSEEIQTSNAVAQLEINDETPTDYPTLVSEDGFINQKFEISKMKDETSQDMPAETKDLIADELPKKAASRRKNRRQNKTSSNEGIDKRINKNGSESREADEIAQRTLIATAINHLSMSDQVPVSQQPATVETVIVVTQREQQEVSIQDYEIELTKEANIAADFLEDIFKNIKFHLTGSQIKHAILLKEEGISDIDPNDVDFVTTEDIGEQLLQAGFRFTDKDSEHPLYTYDYIFEENNVKRKIHIEVAVLPKINDKPQDIDQYLLKRDFTASALRANRISNRRAIVADPSKRGIKDVKDHKLSMLAKSNKGIKKYLSNWPTTLTRAVRYDLSGLNPDDKLKSRILMWQKKLNSGQSDRLIEQIRKHFRKLYAEANRSHDAKSWRKREIEYSLKLNEYKLLSKIFSNDEYEELGNTIDRLSNEYKTLENESDNELKKGLLNEIENAKESLRKKLKKDIGLLSPIDNQKPEDIVFRTESQRQPIMNAVSQPYTQQPMYLNQQYYMQDYPAPVHYPNAVPQYFQMPQPSVQHAYSYAPQMQPFVQPQVPYPHFSGPQQMFPVYQPVPPYQPMESYGPPQMHVPPQMPVPPQTFVPPQYFAQQGAPVYQFNFFGGKQSIYQTQSLEDQRNVQTPR